MARLLIYFVAAHDGSSMTLLRAAVILSFLLAGLLADRPFWLMKKAPYETGIEKKRKISNDMSESFLRGRLLHDAAKAVRDLRK